MIRAVTQFYRFIFTALVIISFAFSVGGFLVIPELNYQELMAIIGLIFYLFFLVTIVGKLAVQLGSNRLLLLIADNQSSKASIRPDHPMTTASRRTINPPLREQEKQHIWRQS